MLGIFGSRSRRPQPLGSRRTDFGTLGPCPKLGEACRHGIQLSLFRGTRLAPRVLSHETTMTDVEVLIMLSCQSVHGPWVLVSSRMSRSSIKENLKQESNIARCLTFPCSGAIA